MKHIFIVNPVSGKEDASIHLLPAIRKSAQETGADLHIEITKARGHAENLAYSFASSGNDVRIYACGGDGTLNEVIKGAYQYKNVEIACVPCGSGNDFVRNFGEAQDFCDITDSINGTAVGIDLMRANDGISAAISSVGVDADVAFGIPKFRRLPFCGGSMAYNLSIMQCLCSRIGKIMRIEVDGKALQDQFLLAAVCNGISYGGGYKAAPTANLRDGMIELVTVKKISRLRIASVLSQYKKGEHIKDNEVIEALKDILTYEKAKHITITPIESEQFIINIDGECQKASSLDVEVLPNAMQFVLPKKLYDKSESAMAFSEKKE